MLSPHTTGGRIFGDNDNDWLVGGTYFDWMFGGWGNDLMNLDDLLETNGGRNDRPEDDEWFRQGDFAYGGADRDVFIGNSGQDRMIDWQGAFNAFYVPFDEFGAPTVYSLYSPLFPPFIRALAFAAGTDVTLTPFEPFDEPAILQEGGTQFPDQFGPPLFPQPGNIPGVPCDNVRGTNPDCVCFVPSQPGPPVGAPGQGAPVPGAEQAPAPAMTGVERVPALPVTEVEHVAALPVTGVEHVPLLEWALLLLLGGALLLLVARRRSHRAAFSLRWPMH